MTILVMVAGCGPRAPAREGASGEAQVSPPPRGIRIADDSIVIEGSWYPIDDADAGSHRANSVKATCILSTRRCREEITTASNGPSPATESFDYKVAEWTKAKLVAERKSGSDQVSIRVALTAFAAEKALVTKKGRSAVEVRWRLE